MSTKDCFCHKKALASQGIEVAIKGFFLELKEKVKQTTSKLFLLQLLASCKAQERELHAANERSKEALQALRDLCKKHVAARVSPSHHGMMAWLFLFALLCPCTALPALLRVLTSRALGAETSSTIQVRFGNLDSVQWYNISGLDHAGRWSEMVVDVESLDLRLVQLRTLGTDAWRMANFQVIVPSGRFGNVTFLPQCCVPLWMDSDNIFAVRMVTIFMGTSPPQPMKLVRSGQGFQLQRRNAGCSNWKEAYLGKSYEKDVSNCAAVCAATEECVAFEIVTNGSCKPLWTDRKGQGYCGLFRQRCQPMHLGMECWDQYEMAQGSWPRAASFILGLVPPMVLLVLYLGKCGVSKHSKDVSSSDSDSDDGSDASTSSSVETWKDPAWAAISMLQLLDLHQKARDEFEEEFPDITMHHVNARILQPLCERFQKCYAHIVNEEAPLFLNVFVSHAWQEGFDEFVQYVASPFRHWSLQPNLWICATALLQSGDPSILAAQVGVGPDDAPFTRALSRAQRLLVVRNPAVNLFERIWCCWELFKAYELGKNTRGRSFVSSGQITDHAAHQ
eukprot:symbB.v1.2.021633.t1/scaffold1882.1/size97200/2